LYMFVRFSPLLSAGQTAAQTAVQPRSVSCNFLASVFPLLSVSIVSQKRRFLISFRTLSSYDSHDALVLSLALFSGKTFVA
jgi:hypothetical protein